MPKNEERLLNLDKHEQEKLDGTEAHVLEDFIDIKFQLGPIAEHGTNGTTIERVIELLIERLEGFQRGPFKCEENDRALSHLDAAKEALEERTKKRKARGVEGTNQA